MSDIQKEVPFHHNRPDSSAAKFLYNNKTILTIKKINDNLVSNLKFPTNLPMDPNGSTQQTQKTTIISANSGKKRHTRKDLKIYTRKSRQLVNHSFDKYLDLESPNN